MSALIKKLLQNSTIKDAAILEDSKYFTEKESVPTSIPMLNVALSGSVKGGLSTGILMIAGPSKHFKSMFALVCAKAYLDKYPDSVLLFYDNEFGMPREYFEMLSIPMDRVIHTPLENAEVFKVDIIKQLDAIQRGDKVIILLDSLGGMASLKELDDARGGDIKADVGRRAKEFKSAFRMVTPYINTKDIPMIIVNHTYETMEMFSKQKVSGGTGVYYSANDIWVVGRQQEKQEKEVTGYNFIINIEKSRSVKEKSKIPISVTFQGGINKHSGLFDVALAGGFIESPKQGWYSVKGSDQKKRRADIENDPEVWNIIFTETDFAEHIEKTYKLTTKAILEAEDDVTELTKTED